MPDQLLGKLVGFFEVVGAVEETVVPIKAQPVDVLFDRIDELGVLFRGVCVVHAEVAEAAVLFRGAEVDQQRFTVADVQIAVGLRREPRVYMVGAPVRQVGVDDVVYKIGGITHIVTS